MASLSGAHILMVDDEEEIRHVVKVLLESEGFTVTEAASGEEALARFTPDTDLVILDVKMPGISGYQVCLRLRERWNVPILFLTAKTQDSDLTMGYSSGQALLLSRADGPGEGSSAPLSRIQREN